MEWFQKVKGEVCFAGAATAVTLVVLLLSAPPSVAMWWLLGSLGGIALATPIIVWHKVRAERAEEKKRQEWEKFNAQFDK